MENIFPLLDIISATVKIIRSGQYAHPARSLGGQNKVGAIKEGMLTNYLICTPDYSEKRIFMGGKELTYY